MNRSLQYVNLFGVLALAVLCVAQWQTNRRLNLQMNALEKTRQEQAQKLSEQDRTIRGLTDDLARFKDQFTHAHQEATDTRKKLGLAERENESLAAQRDQLKASITNWANAVAERDARIAEDNERLRDLAGRLNDSIEKFNRLATNHNDVVSRYNELARKAQGE